MHRREHDTDQSRPGEERVYFTLCFWVTLHHRGKPSRTLKAETREGPGLLTSLFSSTCSTCILTQLRTTYSSETAPPTVGWASHINHQPRKWPPGNLMEAIIPLRVCLLRYGSDCVRVTNTNQYRGGGCWGGGSMPVYIIYLRENAFMKPTMLCSDHSIIRKTK